VQVVVCSPALLGYLSPVVSGRRGSGCGGSRTGKDTGDYSGFCQESPQLVFERGFVAQFSDVMPTVPRGHVQPLLCLSVSDPQLAQIQPCAEQSAASRYGSTNRRSQAGGTPHWPQDRGHCAAMRIWPLNARSSSNRCITGWHEDTELPAMGRRQSCCIEDEGGPLGIGLWDQVSNPAKLRGLRGRVVSVGANVRQW